MSFSVSIVCHVCRVYQHALMISGNGQYWGNDGNDSDDDDTTRKFIVEHVDCAKGTFGMLALMRTDPYTDSAHLPGYTDLADEPDNS